MYKIIGADGKEYGPVTEEKIREWIKEGRANAQTKVRSEGNADWKTLSEFPEFAALLSGATSLPPVQPATPPVQGKLSALAVASLVLGALGLFTLGLTAFLGLLLGILALVRISGSRGALRGKGLALGGTIVSGIFVLMLPVLAAMLLPALAQAKARAQSINCMNNLKQLALGGVMYSEEHQGRLPLGDNWCDAVEKYVGNRKVFQCPAGDSSQPCHYAFNARLAGIDIKALTNPAQTVLFFETDGGWNLSGGPELLISRPRHRNAVGVAFADGHCEIRTRARLSNLKWEP